MHTFRKNLLALLAGLGLLVLPVLALADTGTAVGATVQASVTAPGASANANATVSAKDAAFMTRAKAKGDQELDRRTQNLNDASARVGNMKNLSAADKASIQATVTNNINVLAQLKAKVDADTDAATLRTDVKSITDSYRVYALILPQIRIIAAADRMVTIAGEMSLLGSKLQARIAAASASGADMAAASAALTDYAAKIADAQTQAQAAVTAIATLTPDSGDKTKMAANTKALQDARAKVVAGQKDLIAARADAKTIIEAVKGKPVTASTNASASSTTGVSH